jgi:hypothetical protein
VEVPAAPPLDVVELELSEGVVVSVVEAPGAVPVCDGSPGCGVCPVVVSGTVAPGCGGTGFVLLPPFGVCSLIGELLELCGSVRLLCDDCATAKLAESSAKVAIEISFFISSPRFEWRQWLEPLHSTMVAAPVSNIGSCRYNPHILVSDGLL